MRHVCDAVVAHVVATLLAISPRAVPLVSPAEQRLAPGHGRTQSTWFRAAVGHKRLARVLRPEGVGAVTCRDLDIRALGVLLGWSTGGWGWPTGELRMTCR
ncbi:hypothetical protein Lfu02_75500 [Longispora fulva]|uniref:Uncharacterized protein n=1 Tax=Longispora fulva TaxID=619741 RepID=A0A8J7GHE4_9ACTN|nr:hypothetical protein [Longispora fulva]GIG63178.1 hypothetical protein Lfu02_75500 [Longispora fulva]